MRITAVALAIAMAMACTGGPAEDTEKAALEERVSDLEKENSELEDTIAKQEARAAERMADFRKLMADLQPLMRNKTLELKFVEGRASIGMSSDILFASGSDKLSIDGKRHIAEVTRILATRTRQTFQVEGHTDSEPINSREFDSNYHLGASRAINVVMHMMASGMPSDRISAASYGATKPVAANRPGTMIQNRRIEIVLVPDLSDMPGYDELMREYGPRAGKAGKAGKAGAGKAGKGAGKAGKGAANRGKGGKGSGGSHR